MKKTIKAYFVDPKTNTAKAVDIEPTLETYYDMLGCRCIDIVNRGFGRKGKTRFDIICDDEGLFVDKPYISAIDEHMRTMLVGSLLVVGECDDEGNETSLTDDDVRLLERYTFEMPTRIHKKPYKMLGYVTY